MDTMFHTRDWAVYSVAVYLGLLLGGALAAPRHAWTSDIDAHPHRIVLPYTSEPDHAAADSRSGTPRCDAERFAPDTRNNEATAEQAS